MFGGGKRDRTDDLLLAKQALSQLSYAPAGKLTAATAISTKIQPTDKRGRHKHHSKRRSKTALFKGGDPAAPSGTATLLRLHPSHEAHRGRRPPCGWTNVFW